MALETRWLGRERVTSALLLALACAGLVLAVDGHASVELRHRAVAYSAGLGLCAPFLSTLGLGRRARRFWRRACLSIGALAVGTLALEWAVRSFHIAGLTPAGYRYDARLGHGHVPGQGPIDAWGYRNRAVPERADIVCIGDSQTYGENLTRDAAYPQQLARRTGWTVYNLSHGGYGPLQMVDLTERALTLAPRVVVLGFYLGNDLLDAHRFAALEHWAHLRDPALDYLPQRDISRPRGKPPNLTLKLADWAIDRSWVLQRLRGDVKDALKSTGALKGLYREAQVAERYDFGRVRTAFSPEYRLATVDLARPRVRDGLRITELALGSIAAACQARGVEVVLLLLPTKGHVYHEWLAPRGAPEAAPLAELARAERTAIERVSDCARSHGMRVLDPLPDLVAALAEDRPMWPPDSDGHFNAAGAALLAELLARALEIE